MSPKNTLKLTWHQYRYVGGRAVITFHASDGLWWHTFRYDNSLTLAWSSSLIEIWQPQKAGLAIIQYSHHTQCTHVVLKYTHTHAHTHISNTIISYWKFASVASERICKPVDSTVVITLIMLFDVHISDCNNRFRLNMLEVAARSDCIGVCIF